MNTDPNQDADPGDQRPQRQDGTPVNGPAQHRVGFACPLTALSCRCAVAAAGPQSAVDRLFGRSFGLAFAWIIVLRADAV